MSQTSQVQSFKDIFQGGQNNTLTINQIIQISVSEIKSRKPIASSPYVGLRRFDEGDRDWFFGRDRLVGQLLQKVLTHNLVLVAGASGSGKSSAVRAGLLPQLRAHLPGGHFRTLVMTPDSDPFVSLRGPLQALGIAQQRLRALDARTATALVHTLREQRKQDDLWLLFIDQFEQIFTLCDDQKLRAEFISGLTQLAAAAQNEIKIVLAMRADFFDHFGPYPEFADLAQQGIQLVVDMQAGELRCAIEQPAAHHGMVYEEGLVEQIIADVGGQPGALPLLQYTLDLLWRADNPVDDRTLNCSSYRQIGGVEGALQLRADALYRFSDAEAEIERPAAQRESMRRIFLRLVDMTSPGAEGRAVSRPTPLAHFATLEEQQLIGELIEEKLLVSNAGHAPKAGETATGAIVEIAHEALLRAWPTLRSWVEQAREVLYVRNRLAADARHYAAVMATAPERAADELWGGSRLQQAAEMHARGEFAAVLGRISDEEEMFLKDSESKKTAEEAIKAEADRKLREAHEAVRQQLLNTYVEQGRHLLFEKRSPGDALLWLHRALAEGSRHRSLGDLLKSSFQSVGVGHALLAGAQRSDLRLMFRSDTRYMLTASAMFRPDGRHILTASADHIARVWDVESGDLIRELHGHTERVVSAAYSPDGHHIVTASEDHSARIWDADRGLELRVLTGHQDAVSQVTYSPDGRAILTASADRTARVWDAGTGRLLAELVGHEDVIRVVAFSPDGQQILTAGDDKTTRLWDRESGQLRFALTGHDGAIGSAAYGPDGQKIVTCDGKKARLWESASGQMLREIDGAGFIIDYVKFGPEGDRILGRWGNRSVRVWDVETGGTLLELTGHRELVLCANYRPDGQQIITSSLDRTARVWDANTGQLMAELRGHLERVESAEYSSSGSHILTSSSDGTARIWKAHDGRLAAELKNFEGHVFSAVYAPDGDCILTTSGSQDIEIFNAADRRLVAKIKNNHHRDPENSAVYRPDGRQILTTGWEGARIWDASSRDLIGRLPCFFGPSLSATYSPDGCRIATNSASGMVEIWEADWPRKLVDLRPNSSIRIRLVWSPNGSQIVTMTDHRHSDFLFGFGEAGNRAQLWNTENGALLYELIHEEMVLGAAFSPDGHRIVTVCKDRFVRWWDAERGVVLFKREGHETEVRIVAYSPDGRRVLTLSADGTGVIWDAGRGNPLAQLTGHTDYVRSALYSPDGHRILTASRDHTARIWESDTGRILAVLHHPHYVFSATWSPDGRSIVTACADGVVRIWDATPETRSATEIDDFIRGYVPFRFAREDSDVIVPTRPESNPQ